MLNLLLSVLLWLRCRPSIACAVRGVPGIGKTALVMEAGRIIGYPVIVILASTRDETDIAGLPIYQDDTVKLIAPEWAKKCMDQPCILYFDEMNLARPETLNALQCVVHGRTMPNGQKLHPHTIIITTMNDAYMVGTEEMSPAMNNRFFWVDMDPPNVGDFVRWIKTGSTKHQTVAEREAAEAAEQGALKPEKTSAKPITIEEWRKWFHSNDANGADLKDLIQRVADTGLTLASTNEHFEVGRRVCTPRSLENLLYFAGDAEHAARFAPWFLDEANAQLFKTAYNKMKNSAPNVSLGGNRAMAGQGDDEDRLSTARSVDQKALSRMGIVQLMNKTQNSDVF